MKLSIDLSGQTQAIAMLNGVARRSLDAEPAMTDILADMRRMVSRQFTTAGAYRGPAWPKLAASTEKAKERSKDPRIRANAKRPEIATGAMRASLTDARRKTGASEATDDEVVLASTLKRAGIQHRGAPSKHLPARPFIRVKGADTQRWERILLRHITQNA